MYFTHAALISVYGPGHRAFFQQESNRAQLSDYNISMKFRLALLQCYLYLYHRKRLTWHTVEV
jgi:hypothetical protein